MTRPLEPSWLLNAQTLAGDEDESPAPSYQTVRLSRGRHRSPEEGACAIELASMLEGRHFSDRLYSVDPAIMGLVWGYHDHISDELRQRDLYRVAGVVLKTRRDDLLAARRAEMCRVWALQAQVVCRRRLPWPLRFRRRCELDDLLFDCELAGIAAARLARVERTWHSWTLRFVDMLVWLGSEDDAVPAFAPLAAMDADASRHRGRDAPPARRSSAGLIGAGSSRP